ncbi:GNAT family N-acetyltransferase [Gorillibacterium sp. sgz5001074]|uniref:GNAT family N-acetyltransferase n=1 Tax=Gorillibacterium sp. sgz5001074 TaxID=3446695 RepID=UPI003F661940
MNFNSPVMLDFEEQFETNRLVLRLPLAGDGKEVNQAMMESLNELKPWLIWANREQSPEDTEAIIRQSHIRFKERSDLRFHGYMKDTGELAFCGGLHRIDWNVRKFEIGYWLRSKYAGMGLATEAAAGLEQWAIQTLHANRIEIHVDPHNDKSIKVAQKLGYQHEGTLRFNQWNSTMTQLTDTMIFAKVRGLDY